MNELYIKCLGLSDDYKQHNSVEHAGENISPQSREKGRFLFSTDIYICRKPKMLSRMIKNDETPNEQRFAAEFLNLP